MYSHLQNSNDMTSAMSQFNAVHAGFIIYNRSKENRETNVRGLLLKKTRS